VEVPGITGQHDDAAGRVGFDPVAIEPVTEADLKNTGHDRVDAVLRMSVRHELYL
jgi:hypothetical protein